MPSRDRDGAELERVAAGRVHAVLDGLGEPVERQVAGRDLVPRAGDADLRLGQVVVAHADRAQHAARGGLLDAVGDVAAARLDVDAVSDAGARWSSWPQSRTRVHSVGRGSRTVVIHAPRASGTRADVAPLQAGRAEGEVRPTARHTAARPGRTWGSRPPGTRGRPATRRPRTARSRAPPSPGCAPRPGRTCVCPPDSRTACSTPSAAAGVDAGGVARWSRRRRRPRPPPPRSGGCGWPSSTAPARARARARAATAPAAAASRLPAAGQLALAVRLAGDLLRLGVAEQDEHLVIAGAGHGPSMPPGR